MSNDIKCVIFDLDGTLVNTIDDLGLACDYLLRESGIEPKWSQEDYKGLLTGLLIISFLLKSLKNNINSLKSNIMKLK